MLTVTLKKIFNRDLAALKKEIELYPNEHAIWLTSGEISNSAGNLCLHLIGNLNTYIGAHLGNTGYVRQRELEFSLKNVPAAELLKRIEETMTMIDVVLGDLKAEALAADFPAAVLESKTTTEYFLIHLATHLSYHLGQINYHRRLLA